MKTISRLLLPFILLGSFQSVCQHNPHEKNHASDKHNDANAHMHQRPVAELIRNFESPERNAYQQPGKVIAYLGDLQGKTVMDLGAGSGYFSVRLAKQAQKVIAADVNDEFLAYLKERVAKEGLSNVEVRKVPYDDCGLKEQEADLLLVVNTYHHIENRPAYFAKAARGIKSDGRLVIIDFFKTELPVGPPVPHKLSIDEVVQELKQAGYHSIKVEVNLLPYQYIIEATPFRP